MAKSIRIFLSIVCAVLFLNNSTFHPTNSLGGYTGAPEDSTCLECHTNARSKGTIQIVGIPDTILLGETYAITVQVKDTDNIAQRAGFQMLALNASEKNAGRFELPDGAKNVLIRNAFGRRYVGHKPAKEFQNGVATFDFTWTAPDSAISDTITFYTASILGNGSNGNKGDQFVRTTKPVFLKGSTTSVIHAEKLNVQIVPNPATEILSLSFETVEARTVQLYSMKGQLILSQSIEANNTAIDLQNIQSGLYLIEIVEANKRLLQKIVIQH